jgi:hypothetical protein
MGGWTRPQLFLDRAFSQTMLAELSYFYRQLCAKEITVEMMQKMKKEIPVVLCRMEKNLPPGFFNPMQHLLIHLPYEAKVGIG